MMELLFSDSAKAGMAEAQALCAAKGGPLSGNTEDVLALSLYLDMGDISGDLFAGGAQNRILPLFSGFPEGEEAAETLMQANCADRDALLRRAQAGETVRIWYSRTPSEYCGMLHAVFLLKDMPCPIRLVALPELVQKKDGFAVYTAWDETSPEQMLEWVSGERPLAVWERRAYAYLWKNVRAENRPLRAMVNGMIRSVPADFYDSWIEPRIPYYEFREALVIGRVLGETGLHIADGWIAGRIRSMETAGMLEETVPAEEGSPYTRKMRRRV